MAEEDQSMRILNIEEQKNEQVEEESEKNQIARERARDALWDQMQKEAAIEKEQLIQRLEESAKLRGGKKKRKGGKKKKKKS